LFNKDIEISKNLIGVPFKMNGRDTKGTDCYGLCQMVYNMLDKNLPDFDYSFTVNEVEGMHELIANSEKQFVRIEKPEPYCFVVISVLPPFVSHIGVVLHDCRRFIHTMRGTRVTVELLDSILWQRRIRGFYKCQ
jgi:hypothetical protein